MFPPCFSEVDQPVSPLASKKTVKGALKDGVLSNSMPYGHLKTAGTGSQGSSVLGAGTSRLMGLTPHVTQRRHFLGVLLLRFFVKRGRSLRLGMRKAEDNVSKSEESLPGIILTRART